MISEARVVLITEAIVIAGGSVSVGGWDDNTVVTAEVVEDIDMPVKLVVGL